MPNTGNVVGYRFGTQSEFDNLKSKNSDTLYFVTDTKRLVIGSDEYTRPIQTGTASPKDAITSTANSLYIEDDGTAQTFWYNTTGDPSDWQPVSSFENLMGLADTIESSSAVTPIKAGQFYRFEDWVRLKTKTGYNDPSSYLSLLDTSKACTRIVDNVTDNQYTTALATLKWCKKIVKLVSGQNLPSSLSVQNSYDPSGVLFVKNSDGPEENREYYFCIHRDVTSTMYYQMIYVEFTTYEQLQALGERSITVVNADPDSSYAGVEGQVIYSMSSNALFQCTAANVGTSTYTWENKHTTANITFWDYVTSSSNNFKVPDTFQGVVGDMVVVTTSQTSHTSAQGGEIWQCYQVNTTLVGEKTYLWRKINESVHCLWSTIVPTENFESDLWNIVYCTVQSEVRAYQLTSIDTIENPDWDPEEDPEDEQYTYKYNWTRLITGDDYKHLMLTLSSDPVNGRLLDGATYGELNQLCYSSASNKFFVCYRSEIVSDYPYNLQLAWREVAHVPNITYWNYQTSSSKNFSAEGEPGQLGDMIVITSTGSDSENFNNGGHIWICYMIEYHATTQVTDYHWRELRDGICCQYIQGEPVAQTQGKQFDLRWLGDPQALGQHDDLFRLFQNIGSYGNGINVWKELLTQNSVMQDISSAEYPTNHVPSALAAKTYTDNKMGVPYVNPNTWKVTHYDSGTYHDETYGPENQLFIVFTPENTGSVFIQKDPYESETGVSNIRLVRFDELDGLLINYQSRITLGRIEDGAGKFYLYRYGLSPWSVNLYFQMAGSQSMETDKRIAWYSDLDTCVKVSNSGSLPADNYGYESDPSSPSNTSIMTGEYVVQGDYCTIHATVVLDDTMSQACFSLPIEADFISSVTFKDPSTSSKDLYIAQIDTADKQVVVITPITNNTMSSSTVYFTLTYKITQSNP